MPRKTAKHKQTNLKLKLSFNEAAARCRGKPPAPAGGAVPMLFGLQ